jgi:hypothetical protein
MSAVLYVLLAALLLEAVLVVLVPALRNEFQWLITEKDELPDFDKAALEKTPPTRCRTRPTPIAVSAI